MANQTTSFGFSSSSGGGGGGSGTVTSVAMTVPSALAVSGSPITGAGTLAVTGAGTTDQFIDGTGALKNLSNIASILTQTSVAVSNAEVIKMKYNNEPITLVGAQAGKIHIPVSVTFLTTWATPNESSSDDMRVGWDAATSAASDYFIGIRDFMNGVSSGTHTAISAPFQNGFTVTYPDTAVNKPLQAWCSDIFNGGWSMTIYTTYYSITV
jgi:hypothetical protein